MNYYDMVQNFINGNKSDVYKAWCFLSEVGKLQFLKIAHRRMEPPMFGKLLYSLEIRTENDELTRSVS